MESKSVARVLEINDLNEVAEIIGIYLQNPVLIENDNFELIAYSSKYNDKFDPSHQKTILTKKCPEFVVERLRREGIISQLETKNEPIRVLPIEEVGLFERLVISAGYQQQVRGYIWIQESNEQVTEEGFEFLQQIAGHVGKLIYLKGMQMARTHHKDHLLQKIIHHQYQNKTLVKQEAEAINLIIPKAFSIVLLSWANAGLEQTDIEQLKQNVHLLIGRMGKATYWLEEDTQITIVIGKSSSQGNSTAQVAKDFVKECKARIPNMKQNVMLAIGSEYEELEHMRKSYLEAVEVIELMTFMEKDSGIIPVQYERLGLYRYMKTIYDKNIEDSFVNPDLLTLKKHDESNQSELLKTLKLYLQNNCKLKQTAESLFIHPNTLNYRIKQIRQLIPIDFDDFDTKCQLYIELLLLDNNTDYRKLYDRKN